MTSVLERPPSPSEPAGAPGAAAVRPSLARAEVRRLSSRRFVRVLLLLSLVGYLLAVGLAAATGFAKTTPEQLAAAQRNIDRVVAEQNSYREQCLKDPSLPPGVPPEQACGPPPSAADFPPEQFLDKQPFVLSDALPGGGLAVAAATSVLAFVIGATYVGAEWSSRSMVALLFWEPRRGRVLLTKIAVLVTFLAALAVVAQALWWGTSVVMARTLGTTDLPAGFYGDLLAQQGRSVLLVLFAGLLGFGVSNLIRNTGAALGVGFVYFAVVENAVRAVKGAWGEWLLSDNAAALVLQGGHTIYLYDESYVDEQGAFVSSGRELLLSNLHGGLVLATATALLVGLGVLLFARRDLH